MRLGVQIDRSESNEETSAEEEQSAVTSHETSGFILWSHRWAVGTTVSTRAQLDQSGLLQKSTKDMVDLSALSEINQRAYDCTNA